MSERDDELAPVELDGSCGQLDHVDQPGDLLELAAGAAPEGGYGPEAVEISVACHGADGTDVRCRIHRPDGDFSFLPQYRSAAPVRDDGAAERIAELTPRERDVLRLIGRGASNTEIAESLFVSEATVKSHIGRIFTKLDLRDRAAAIVFAFDHGLVAPQGF